MTGTGTVRSSAATGSSWCDAWLHITAVGVSFRLSFALFRLTLTFPMAPWLPRSGMLSLFPSFPLPCWELFSSCLVVLLFYGQTGGVFARPLLCHQLAAAFQGESLVAGCLCHPLYTRVRITALGSGHRELSLGKYCRKGSTTVPLLSGLLKKNHLATERASRPCLNILSCSWKREMGLSPQ